MEKHTLRLWPSFFCFINTNCLNTCWLWIYCDLEGRKSLGKQIYDKPKSWFERVDAWGYQFFSYESLVHEKLLLIVSASIGNCSPTWGANTRHHNTPQLVEQFGFDIFSIPWGHHKLLIDKFLKEPQKYTVWQIAATCCIIEWTVRIGKGTETEIKSI